LLNGGFLRQGKPGLRGRTKYRVTQPGKKFLKNGWLPLIEAGPSSDVDADLRAGFLTLSAGGNRRQADDLLRRAAQITMESMGASDPAKDLTTVAPLARWQSELRSSGAKMMLAAQSSAIVAMADALPRESHWKTYAHPSAAKKHNGA
jgi:hypothetical protein